MTVSDIYGGDYGRFNLKGDVVASAFGKLVGKPPDKDPELAEADIARSLANMISINIAQIAYLCAMQHGVSRMIFAGNFLRGNRLAQLRISYSVSYWSQGKMRAFFLKHEGYCGALGAWLIPTMQPEREDAQEEASPATN